MPGSSDLPSSVEESRSTSNSSTSSWKYGLVADIWAATMVGWRPYKVLLDPTDDGSSWRSQSYTTIPHDKDSFIEAVYSVDEWNRLVCKDLCSEICNSSSTSRNAFEISGRVKIRAAGQPGAEGRDDRLYILTDKLAAAFGDILCRQSTVVHKVTLRNTDVDQLSLEGFRLLARGVARSPGLQVLVLIGFGEQRSENSQLKLDAMFQSLLSNGGRNSLSTLQLEDCCLPSCPDATLTFFANELSSLRKIKLTRCKMTTVAAALESCDSSRATHSFPTTTISQLEALERGLKLNRSLESVILSSCPCELVQSFLKGLSGHASLREIQLSDIELPLTKEEIPLLPSSSDEHLLEALNHFGDAQASLDQPIVRKLKWELNSPIGFGFDLLAFCCLPNLLTSLDLQQGIVNKTDATCLRYILESSSGLRELRFKFDHCQLSEYNMIAAGLRQQRLLVKLDIYLNDYAVLETISSALESSNSRLEILRLSSMNNYGLNLPRAQLLRDCLARLSSLRHVDLIGCFCPFADEILMEVWNGLEEKTCLVEHISWERLYTSQECEEEVKLLCLTNRRLQRHCPELFKAPDKVPLGLWAHIFASVSPKPHALYSLLKTFTPIVENILDKNLKRNLQSN